MARNYQDVTAARRACVSPAAKAHREVLQQEYDIAMQIIELGERSCSRPHRAEGAPNPTLPGVEQCLLRQPCASLQAG